MNEFVNVEKTVERIIEIRKNSGISLEYMAEQLNISTAAYHKIERSETKLTLDRLIEISKALEVSIAELLGIRVEKYFTQEVGEKGVGHQYNGDIKALYNENSELSKSYISSLQAEVQFLKEVIAKNGML